MNIFYTSKQTNETDKYVIKILIMFADVKK